MDTLAVKKNNLIQAARTVVKVKADASGKVPTEIELVPSGTWPNSYKGNLEITVGDLQEMAANFVAGIGLPDGGSEGAPVDYSHNDWERAAGWIVSVRVDGGRLLGEIAWTPAAEQAIRDGEFKFISPSFYPACLGMWCDPENPSVTGRNVLLGAGLTNIPFFKGMSGVKASQSENGESSKLIFISASQEREKDMSRTLEEILATPVNEVANLSDEDKATLAEHKDELSADHQVLFGLVEKAEPTVTPTNVVENADDDGAGAGVPADAAAVQASIKAGTHKLVATSELESLQASVKAQGEQLAGYNRERIEASVAKHVARGAIKADQQKDWADKIEKDASMLTMLEALHDNPVMASENGDSGSANISATLQIKEKAEALMASAKAENKVLDMGQATSRVLKENPELAKQYQEESNPTVGKE